MAGSRPKRLDPESDDVLENYLLTVGKVHSGRVGVALLKATAAEIFIKGKRAVAFGGDIDVGSARWTYVEDCVRRWIKSRELALRSPTTTVEMRVAETEKRMGVLHRNLARAGCLWPRQLP